ncbi:MAG: nucleotidyltransferase [Verrucomicrobia bacterium]|nr:nucleotidyltransferase [Verrucomicrobiota bacterium]
MDDLVGIIDRLIRAKVDFVLVGGLAAVTHGSSMTTQDIDVCCDFSTANLLRLQSALTGTHPVHRMTTNRIPLQLTEENCGRLKNLYLDTDIGQLDCLGNILGLGDFHAVKQQGETIEVDGHPCRILRIEALITAKKAMGRPKDLQTIQQLEVIQKERQESSASVPLARCGDTK